MKTLNAIAYILEFEQWLCVHKQHNAWKGIFSILLSRYITFIPTGGNQWIRRNGYCLKSEIRVLHLSLRSEFCTNNKVYIPSEDFRPQFNMDYILLIPGKYREIYS